MPTIPVKPEGNKRTRMSVQSAKFASGQVFLPTEAFWLDQLEMELFSFPGGRFDDQIDSISQALACEMSTYELTDEAVAGFERVAGGPLLGLLRSCPMVW